MSQADIDAPVDNSYYWNMTGTGVGRRRPTRRVLKGSITESLGRRIVSGEVAPGGHLATEVDLADEFGVGRGVVREAIKALEAKGLVVARPRTGMQVLDREHWNFLDADLLRWFGEFEPDRCTANLADLRRAFEPHAAELAASRATSEDIMILEAAIIAMRAAAGFDPVEFAQADLRFHQAVLRATHNDLLASFGHATQIALQRSFEAGAHAPGAAEAAVPHHELLLTAIRMGDSSIAAAAASRLVDASAHDIATAAGVVEL